MLKKMPIEVFAKIDEVVSFYEDAEKQLKKFHEGIECFFKDDSYPRSPVNGLSNECKAQKQDAVSFILTKISELNPSLVIEDKNKYYDFAESQEIFNSREIAEAVYKDNEKVDSIVFRQIQEKVFSEVIKFVENKIDSPGYNPNEGRRKQPDIPEEIVRDGKNFLKLNLYGYEWDKGEKINNLVRYINIVIGGVPPSESTARVADRVKDGDKFCGLNFDLIQTYKNGSMKVKFDSPADMEKFIKSLFMDWDAVSKSI